MRKFELPVEGMHCAACELVIEKKIRKLSLIESVDAHLDTNKVEIETKEDIEKSKLIEQLEKIINEEGYSFINKNEISKKNLVLGLLIAIIIFIAFLGLQKFGFERLLSGGGNSLSFVFLLGIVASLSSCMAVVGGLVLSISSNYAQAKDKKTPLIAFHLARLVSFFILGGVLGAIGSVFSLSTTFYFVASILLFLVMMILGINLLEVFPIFSKLQLRMPKHLTKKVLQNDMVTNRFTPIFLGAITFFLPCGFTQSTQFMAITSGKILEGAEIMGTFALGTLPILALISFSTFKLSKDKKLFPKVAGFIVIIFAIYNLLASLTAAGIIAPIL